MRRTEADMLAEIEQYSGRIFPGTNMTIHGFAGRNERNQILVECSSESRGKFIAVWNEVKRGNTKGTVRGELRIKRNKYEIDGDIVRVYFKSGEYFICDTQDLPLIQKYTWYLNMNGYARSAEGKYFHRLVMDTPDDYIIDHINRNKLDDRKENLRICKQIDNSHNMGMFSTNSSGHTGVYKNKSGKYEAEIVVDYKKIFLGAFDKYEDACDAYDRAKKLYHSIGGDDNDGLTGAD